MGAIPLGILLMVAGAGVLGGVLLVSGFVGWVLVVAAGWVGALRRERGRPMFGGSSVMAEANWWLGWGPIPEAAGVLEADAENVRRLARWAVLTTVALWVLVVPVAALAS